MIIADMSGADLSEANLSRANLNRATLIGAILFRADLSEAILTEANLNRANLIGTDLHGANLSEASLSKADLKGANLSAANMSETVLNRTVLNQAILTKANLSGADLSRASLGDADLSGANLNKANLSNAYLASANLSEANLNRANLSETYLGMTELSGADLSTAIQYKTHGLVSSKPGLRLRIVEEPLTIQHLVKTLDTLTVLYVKLWLLEQQRFNDFERYSHVRNRSLEDEVPLPIAELTYNSPANIKVNIDFSPKGVIEALQTLIDTIIHIRVRKQQAEVALQAAQLENHFKAEKLKQERLTTIEQAFGTLEQGIALVDKLSPGLDKKKKEYAAQSLAREILSLASDSTVEISLVPPPVAAPGTKKVSPSPSTTASVQKTP